MKKETTIEVIAIIILMVTLGALLYLGLNSNINDSNNEFGLQGGMQGAPRYGE